MDTTPAQSFARQYENTDSVVQAVLSKFLQRAEFGKRKYGHTLDRGDLSVAEWINHAQEELMDGILYLQKLKMEIHAPVEPNPPSPRTVSSSDSTNLTENAANVG